MDPLFLSPALPSDLLQFIINSCTYPTTLVICADRAEFLSSLTQDILHHHHQQQQQPQSLPADQPLDTPTPQRATTDPSHSNPPPPPPPPADYPKPNSKRSQQQQQNKPHPLLAPHLAQLVTTRSIRTVFVPTVTHLRAYLSVFSAHPSPSSPLPTTSSSKRHNKPPHLPPPPPPPPPPPQQGEGSNPPPPRLVVYDFLALHRGSSEWSVQGLGASSAALVEAGRREGVEVVVVEGVVVPGSRPVDLAGEGEAPGVEMALGRGMATIGEVLAEGVPVLSGGGGRKVGGELEGSGWIGKTVGVGRVLGRWFRFRDGEWAVGERVGGMEVVEDNKECG